MKKKLTYNSILLSFMFFSFHLQSSFAQNIPDKFYIEGNIQGAVNGTLIKLYDIDQQQVLDSTHINNEKFIFKGHVDMPTTCWIQCESEYAIVQVENVNMKFNSPLKLMRLKYTATGGREQSLQNKLDGLQRPYDRIFMGAYDSLNNKSYSNDIDKNRLIKIFNDAQNTSMKIYVNFGEQNIDSYLGLDIVYRNRKSIPKDSLIYIFNSLTDAYKKSPKGKSLEMYLYGQTAQEGMPMIDFKAKRLTGKPFKLSSLKGKYIYLTFGSAGCGPCRMENREISKNYDQLSKLMEIVYFSLDKNKIYWQNVTKEDKIVWTNISDMAGDYGKIKTMYGVQSMPTSFLIDKNGIIVKKIEWYDSDTLTKFAQLIKNNN